MKAVIAIMLDFNNVSENQEKHICFDIFVIESD